MAKVKEQKISLGGAKSKPQWIESKKPGMAAKAPAAPAPKAAMESQNKPAIVINKLKHNVILSYNGEGMVVAPQARAKITNWDKLGSLPRGVMLIKGSPRTK